jgi:hypothetical protein
MKKTGIQLLRVYLFTWLFAFLFFLFNTFSGAISWNKLFNSFIDFGSSAGGLLTIHITFLIFYVIFLLARYYISIYRKYGFLRFLKQLILRLVLPITLIVYGFIFIIKKNSQEDFEYTWNHSIENNTHTPKKKFLKDAKIRGMSVYKAGRNRKLNISALIKTNVEWIAVIPYFYQKDEQSKSMYQPAEIGVWSPRDSIFIQGIHDLRKKGFYTMLKPHLWMSSGWRSNINFESLKDWNHWFDGYRKNMLHYAHMAKETGAELFCIGTELESSMKSLPERWVSLIKEIKSIYTGKLTYAANWNDDLKSSPIWKEMDFIGVQAYFPLTEKGAPTLLQIKNGWDTHIPTLQSLSKQYQKPILFTEVGYRNDLYATVNPWEWESFYKRLYRKKSDRTQQLAFQALFEKLWNEAWFAGVFPWEWNSSDFPIYKRPAQNTIAIWYHK